MSSQGNNINLVVFKAFLFFFISSYVLRIIFSSVYFKQLGLSSSQTGLLQGASPIARAFGAFGLGFLADHSDRRKMVFLIAVFSSTVTPFLLTLARPKKKKCIHKSSRVELTSRNNHGLWDVSFYRWSSSTRKNTSLSSGTFKQKELHLWSTSQARTNMSLYKKNYRSKQSTIPEKRNQLLSNNKDQYLAANVLQKMNDEINELIKLRTLREEQIRILKNTDVKITKTKWKSRELPKQLKWHNNYALSSTRKLLWIQLESLYETSIGSPNNKLVDNDLTRDKVHEDSNMGNLFGILLLITIIGDFISGPALNLSDTAIVSSLGDNKDKYGRVRLWGDLGQMMLVPSVALMEHYLKITVYGGETGDFAFSLWVTSAGMGFALLIGFKVSMPSSKQKSELSKTDSEKTENVSTLMIVRDFMAPLENWSILVDALFLGVFLSAIQTFLFWTMIDLDASQASLSIGVSNLCRNITSTTAYYVSNMILQKFGTRNVINLSIATYLISFSISAFFRNPWLAVIPDCLVYMAYAFSLTACVLHVNQAAPVAWSGTVQGILQFTYNGVGQGVGPLITGAVMDSLGQTCTYLLFDGIALLLLTFSLVVQLTLRVKSRNTEYQQLPKEIQPD